MSSEAKRPTRRGASLALNGAILAVIAGASAAQTALMWRSAESGAIRAESAAVVQALLMAQLAPSLARDAEIGDGVAASAQRLAARVLLVGVLDSNGTWKGLGAPRGWTFEDIRRDVNPAALVPRIQPIRRSGSPSFGARLVTLPLHSAGDGNGPCALAAVVDVGNMSGTTPDISGALLAAAAGLTASAGWLVLTIVRPVRGVARAAAGEMLATASCTLPRELEDLTQSITTLQTDLKRWKLEAHTLKQTLEERVTRRTHTVERALRHAELVAETDALSGLRNRRAFERDFATLYSRAESDKAELCVALIDIDHFKVLNDTLGHAAGDALITFVGELLTSTTRKGVDMIARLGGDEFVAALSGTGLQEARMVMERVCSLFAQHARTIGGVPQKPAMSIGIASLREHQPGSKEKMLAQADDAMYAAKRAGRAIMTPSSRHTEPYVADTRSPRR